MSTESAPKKDSTAANKGKSNQAQSTATGLPKESTTTPKKKLSPVPSVQTSAPTKQPVQKLSRDHSSNRSGRAGSVASPIKGPQTLQSVSIPSKSSPEDGAATSTDDTPTKETTPQFLSPLFFLLGLILALTPVQPGKKREPLCHLRPFFPLL
uniref:Uncharacterized protein n=1 Tax=Cacopsylla melanoneura TaxID=428564 RepID=A0A8D8TZM3_9HEMI